MSETLTYRLALSSGRLWREQRQFKTIVKAAGFCTVLLVLFPPHCAGPSASRLQSTYQRPSLPPPVGGGQNAGLTPRGPVTFSEPIRPRRSLNDATIIQPSIGDDPRLPLETGRVIKPRRSLEASETE